jgi:hypothetical protein
MFEIATPRIEPPSTVSSAIPEVTRSFNAVESSL